MDQVAYRISDNLTALALVKLLFLNLCDQLLHFLPDLRSDWQTLFQDIFLADVIIELTEFLLVVGLFFDEISFLQ